jgi:hypothetical protein
VLSLSLEGVNNGEQELGFPVGSRRLHRGLAFGQGAGFELISGFLQTACAHQNAEEELRIVRAFLAQGLSLFPK